MTTIALVVVGAIVSVVAFVLAVSAWGLAAFVGTVVYIVVGTALVLWALGLLGEVVRPS